MSGVPPFVSTSGDTENINFATGALNLSIPVLSLPQLNGRSITLSLLYGSNAFVLKKTAESYQETTDPNPEGPPQGYNVSANFAWQANATPSGLHWNLPTLSADEALQGSVNYPTGNGTSVTTQVQCKTNWTFTDWNGTSHQFNNSRDCSFQFGQFLSKSDINVDYSSDGSSIRLDTTNPRNIVVTTKDGTVYHYLNYPGQPGNSTYSSSYNNAFEITDYYYSYFSSIVDPNGNTMTVATSQSNGNSVLADTVGRTFTFGSGTLTYADTNGTSRTVTIASGGTTKTNGTHTGAQFASNGSYTFQHPGANGTCQMTPESNQTQNPQISVMNVVANGTGTQTITIPTGQGNNLIYVLGTNPIGELTYIQYPSGGYTTFDWDDTSYIVMGTTYYGQVFGDLSCPMEHHEVIAKHQCSLNQGVCSRRKRLQPPTSPPSTRRSE